MSKLMRFGTGLVALSSLLRVDAFAPLHYARRPHATLSRYECLYASKDENIDEKFNIDDVLAQAEDALQSANEAIRREQNSSSDSTGNENKPERNPLSKQKESDLEGGTKGSSPGGIDLAVPQSTGSQQHSSFGGGEVQRGTSAISSWNPTVKSADAWEEQKPRRSSHYIAETNKYFARGKMVPETPSVAQRTTGETDKPGSNGEGSELTGGAPESQAGAISSWNPTVKSSNAWEEQKPRRSSHYIAETDKYFARGKMAPEKHSTNQEQTGKTGNPAAGSERAELTDPVRGSQGSTISSWNPTVKSSDQWDELIPRRSSHYIAETNKYFARGEMANTSSENPSIVQRMSGESDTPAASSEGAELTDPVREGQDSSTISSWNPTVKSSDHWDELIPRRSSHFIAETDKYFARGEMVPGKDWKNQEETAGTDNPASRLEGPEPTSNDPPVRESQRGAISSWNPTVKSADAWEEQKPRRSSHFIAETDKYFARGEMVPEKHRKNQEETAGIDNPASRLDGPEPTSNDPPVRESQRGAISSWNPTVKSADAWEEQKPRRSSHFIAETDKYFARGEMVPEKHRKNQEETAGTDNPASRLKGPEPTSNDPHVPESQRGAISSWDPTVKSADAWEEQKPRRSSQYIAETDKYFARGKINQRSDGSLNGLVSKRATSADESHGGSVSGKALSSRTTEAAAVSWNPTFTKQDLAELSKPHPSYSYMDDYFYRDKSEKVGLRVENRPVQLNEKTKMTTESKQTPRIAASWNPLTMMKGHTSDARVVSVPRGKAYYQDQYFRDLRGDARSSEDERKNLGQTSRDAVPKKQSITTTTTKKRSVSAEGPYSTATTTKAEKNESGRRVAKAMIATSWDPLTMTKGHTSDARVVSVPRGKAYYLDEYFRGLHMDYYDNAATDMTMRDGSTSVPAGGPGQASTGDTTSSEPLSQKSSASIPLATRKTASWDPLTMTQGHTSEARVVSVPRGKSQYLDQYFRGLHGDYDAGDTQKDEAKAAIPRGESAASLDTAVDLRATTRLSSNRSMTKPIIWDPACSGHTSEARVDVPTGVSKYYYRGDKGTPPLPERKVESKGKTASDQTTPSDRRTNGSAVPPIWDPACSGHTSEARVDVPTGVSKYYYRGDKGTPPLPERKVESKGKTASDQSTPSDRRTNGSSVAPIWDPACSGHTSEARVDVPTGVSKYYYRGDKGTPPLPERKVTEQKGASRSISQPVSNEVASTGSKPLVDGASARTVWDPACSGHTSEARVDVPTGVSKYYYRGDKGTPPLPERKVESKGKTVRDRITPSGRRTNGSAVAPIWDPSCSGHTSDARVDVPTGVSKYYYRGDKGTPPLPEKKVESLGTSESEQTTLSSRRSTDKVAGSVWDPACSGHTSDARVDVPTGVSKYYYGKSKDGPAWGKGDEFSVVSGDAGFRPETTIGAVSSTSGRKPVETVSASLNASFRPELTIGAVKSVFVQPKKTAPRDVQPAEVEEGHSSVDVDEQMAVETTVADGEQFIAEETKGEDADDSSVPFFVREEPNEE